MHHHLAELTPLIERWGYAVVFAAVFVEGFGAIAPGQSLLIAGALVAARGELSIGWLLAVSWSAAFLGNGVGYAIGARGGRALLLKLRVNVRHLERVERFFARYGGWVVVFARFLDGFRQLNGIVAGTVGMPWGAFTAYNALGAALWTGVWGLGAFALERHVETLRAPLERARPFLLSAAGVAVALLLGYLLVRQRRVAPGAPRQGDASGPLE